MGEPDCAEDTAPCECLYGAMRMSLKSSAWTARLREVITFSEPSLLLGESFRQIGSPLKLGAPFGVGFFQLGRERRDFLLQVGLLGAHFRDRRLHGRRVGGRF